ncbi:unnamed protein product, partial [Rotaria sp. Silwood1]
MPGEHGSRIEDDVRTSSLSNNRPYLTATVYEDGTYRLHVQLDCGGQLSGDPLDSPCSRSLTPPTTPFVCPLSIARINLVIMAGEKGTEIRDDKPTTSLA